MSTDIFKVIQSSGSSGSWVANLGKKALINVAIPLARDNLLGLVSNLASNAINKFERETNGKRAAKAGKGFTLFILNENMNDIIKIIKLFEDSGVLIDRVIETVKHEIKKTRRWIPWSFVSTFSCFINTLSNFFSSKRYKWKKSSKSRKRIYG